MSDEVKLYRRAQDRWMFVSAMVGPALAVASLIYFGGGIVSQVNRNSASIEKFEASRSEIAALAATMAGMAGQVSALRTELSETRKELGARIDHVRAVQVGKNP